MRSVTILIAASTLHFLIGLWISSKSFAYVFSSIDTGRELSITEKIYNFAVDLLFFPIVTIFINTGYEGSNLFTNYFPFIINSALWGIIIAYGCKIIFKSTDKIERV